MPRPELTEQEIDLLLERFDKTEAHLQRGIIARLFHDRAILLQALEMIAEFDSPSRYRTSRSQCEQVARKAVLEVKPDAATP